MKKILGILATICILFSGAFAQQGYYNSVTPGWAPGNTATFGVCQTATAVATCIATPDVVITSDVAGQNTITQPLSVPYSGAFPFYAAPGLYQICTAQTAPGRSSTRCRLITVPPDVNGNVSLADGVITVPAPGNCFEAASTNAGSGDGTTILDGSVPAVKGILSASGAGNLVFTCQFAIPNRTTSGKGMLIQDISFNYAVQTNTLDSWAATLKSFTGPASGASQTPASATLVAAFGGTLTLSTFTGNGATSAAGSYYTQKVSLGTPTAVADRQVLVLQLTGAHAGANAITVTVPTLVIHYKLNSF